VRRAGRRPVGVDVCMLKASTVAEGKHHRKPPPFLPQVWESSPPTCQVRVLQRDSGRSHHLLVGLLLSSSLFSSCSHLHSLVDLNRDAFCGYGKIFSRVTPMRKSLTQRGVSRQRMLR
jgi:hypothetical protein